MSAHIEDSDEVARALYSIVDALHQLENTLAIALPQITKSLDLIATEVSSWKPAQGGRG